MADLLDNNDMGGITSETMRRALGDRYLQYALSTITNRALPDARDGLKPVSYTHLTLPTIYSV